MSLVHPITNPVQLQSMIDYLYEHSKRDYVLFEIGINLGIRVTDFSHQKVGFYRKACEQGYVDMTPSKTAYLNKKILVPINKDLQSLILQYIEGRSDDEWMFPSRKGEGPITRQHIHRIITEAAEHAGIKEPIGCHGMRKTFGYWHYKQNRDIRILMNIFNHSSEEVTLRYIGVTDEEKRKSMNHMNIGVRNLNE